MNKKITIEEFKKFADDNDILWFYNKPYWNRLKAYARGGNTRKLFNHIWEHHRRKYENNV